MLGRDAIGKKGHVPAMKNQSLRGKLEVSMICVGAIGVGSMLSRVNECGGSNCKVRGFLPGLHVIDTLSLLDGPSGLWLCS